MYLIAIAWMYVVLMMTVAEALSTQGTVIGALFTLLLYGLLPLGILMYILGTPGRRKLRRAAEAASASEPPSLPVEESGSAPPDGSRHAAGSAVAAERKEP
jgi:hypothetical protein